MSNFQVVCSHLNARLRHPERPPTTGPVTFSCAMLLRCWMVALRVMTNLGQLSRIRSSRQCSGGLGRVVAHDSHRHLHAGAPHLGQVHDEIALEHADAPHAHLVAQASRVAVDDVLEHAGFLGSLKLLVGSTGCSSRPPTPQAV